MELILALLGGLIIGGGAIALLFKRKKDDSPETAILQEKLNQLILRKDELQNENRMLTESLQQEKIERAKSEEQVRAKDEAMANWEKHKQEFLDASKAAVLESANQVSSKLIKDHKSESETARKSGEEHFGKITTDVLGSFRELTKQVNEVKGRMQTQENVVTTLNRALTEPAKIGRKAEISLENHLKALRLTEGRDYLLQHSFDSGEGKLRPDAVVFLPDNYVLVIDSKTSVFLTDLENAQSEEEYQNLLHENIKSSMKSHLQNLRSKDYQTAVRKGVVSSERNFEPNKVITLMWLMSDGLLERIHRAEPSFLLGASNQGITVVGPSGLNSALTIAAARISTQIQNENQSVIVKETENLLETIGVALEHADKAGRNLTTAYNSFDKFAASVNRRLLPKAAHLIKLGVNSPAKGFKSLPRNPDMEAIDIADESEVALPEKSQDD